MWSTATKTRSAKILSVRIHGTHRAVRIGRNRFDIVSANVYCAGGWCGGVGIEMPQISRPQQAQFLDSHSLRGCSAKYFYRKHCLCIREFAWIRTAARGLRDAASTKRTDSAMDRPTKR